MNLNELEKIIIVLKKNKLVDEIVDIENGLNH